jgi:hypothetical protein
MHDALELEKKGIPTAVICTEPFITSAIAMSKLGGIPDYPFAIVEHPLGSLDQKSLRATANKVAVDIAGILLRGN